MVKDVVSVVSKVAGAITNLVAPTNSSSSGLGESVPPGDWPTWAAVVVAVALLLLLGGLAVLA